MLFWTPHFKVLDSTFSVLDSTFWLDSTLKIDVDGDPLVFDYTSAESAATCCCLCHREPRLAFVNCSWPGSSHWQRCDNVVPRVAHSIRMLHTHSIRRSVSDFVFQSLFMSRLDYSNTCRAPIVTAPSTWSVLNTATSKSLFSVAMSTSHRYSWDLHWLRSPERIDFKLTSVLVYHVCILGAAVSVQLLSDVRRI